jgi:hypothetical protein
VIQTLPSTSQPRWTRKERCSAVLVADSFSGTRKNKKAMTKEELELMRLQLKVLKSVEEEYAGRTIGNIINNIESRISYGSKHGNTNRAV